MIRLGVLTDLHWAVEPPVGEAWNNPYDFAGLAGRVERALRTLEDAGAEAIVVLGDLCHWGDAASMRAGLDAVTATALPVWAIPGNHDRAQDARRFEAVVGERVLAESGSTGLSRTAVDADGAPREPGPRRPGPLLTALGVETGHGWKEGRIAAGDWTPPRSAAPLVVASHYPLVSSEPLLTGAGFCYSEDALDREQTLARLAGTPAVVLSGHVHARVSSTDGSVLQLLQPALIEPPYECALIEIADATVRRRSIAAAPADAARLPIFCAADETWAYADGAWRLMRPPSPAQAPRPPGTRSRAGGSAPA